jgi:hypothetical protein
MTGESGLADWAYVHSRDLELILKLSFEGDMDVNQSNQPWVEDFEKGG